MATKNHTKHRSVKNISKHKHALPTKPCFDPFLNILVYINKNGRTVGYRDGRWQAV